MPPRRLISDKIVIKEASGFSYSDNVGIGTTVVTANFQVFKSGNTDAFRIQSETQTSFIVDNNGNVGIGMAQPGEWKLNVDGSTRLRSTQTSNLDITVLAQDPNATAPLRIATTASTPLFTISPTGNVGIGTAQTGTNTLRVQGTTDSTAGYTVGDTTVVNASGNIPSADRLPVVTVQKGGTGQTNLSANKLLVGNATTAVITPANLHWDNATGRLGVGTATPLQTFNVFGNALIDGTLTASNLTVIGDFTTLNTLTSNTEQMVINNAGTGPALIVRQSGAQPVAEFFDVESGTALHIANNGNVGIGTTTVTQALQVQGNISLSGGNRFIGTPTANTLSLRTNNTDQVTLDANGNVGIGTNIPLAELHVLQTGTAPAFRVDDVANDTTPFLIDASGNVGIGTTTPGANTLLVQGNIKATSSIDTDTQFLGQASDTATAPSFSFTSDTNTGMYRAGTDILAFTTAGSERVRIAASGSVGIGTNNPLSTLHVNGDARATTLTSTQATGTAPLTVASTTVVTNLNADLLDGLHASSGNTGSTVVARDANGNFSAGTISATQLTGFGVGTNYVGAGSGHDNATLSQYNMAIRSWWGIGFPSYDNVNRIVFDTRTGAITANTFTGALSQTLTRGSYLTGNNFNGSAATTWAVDATNGATPNKVVARDANGDFDARYINTSYVNMSHATETRSSDTIFYSSTDNYIRKTNSTGMRAALNVPTRTGGDASGTWNINITGSAGSANSLSIQTLGGVGTYAFLNPQVLGLQVEGTNVAGSSLRYGGTYQAGTTNPNANDGLANVPNGALVSGTWRIHGRSGVASRTGPCLWYRIS